MLLLVIVVVNLFVQGYTKQVYYPDYPLPHAIVFDGPTNYNENKHRSEEANEIDDFELDVRFGREDNCPQGYHKEGDVCFPND